MELMRMTKIKLFIILVTVAWPNIVGARFEIQLLDQDNKPISQAVVSIPSETAMDLSAKVAVMDQINKQFVPHVLTVNQGQFVSFPNSDNIRHHVYSFSDPKSFEIKLYRGTPTSPDLFDKPGIVILGCNIHDHMVGYIYVADNELTVITDENGMAGFDAQAPDKVKIWHSRLSKSADKIISKPLEKKNELGVWQVTANLQPLVVKQPRKFKARFK
jgi:plastocyanin